MADGPTASAPTSTYRAMGDRAHAYWAELFGPGAVSHTLATVTISVVGIIFVIGFLPYFLPASLMRAFRGLNP